MENKEQYIALMSEIIAKQAIILGPDIAVLKARNVPGIVVADNGTVTDVGDNLNEALQKLVDEYVSLSGQIVKNTLVSVFSKYPNVPSVN